MEENSIKDIDIDKILSINLERPLIFFDLETTGADIKKDRIIEIYGKKIHPDGKIEEYYQLLDPLIPIDEEATNIHGYTNESLSGYPTMGTKAQEIYEFFKDCDLGGYNVIKFDIPFLMEELTRHKFIYTPINMNIIDPYKIVGKMETNKLEDVYARYFGEKFDNAHSAEADINATIRVFEHQIDKYSLDKNIKSISDFARSDSKGNKFIDFGGVFYRKDNEYYLAIGKYKNNLAKNHLSYLEWIVNKSDMQQNTKVVASSLLDFFMKKKGE